MWPGYVYIFMRHALPFYYSLHLINISNSLLIAMRIELPDSCCHLLNTVLLYRILYPPPPPIDVDGNANLYNKYIQHSKVRFNNVKSKCFKNELIFKIHFFLNNHNFFQAISVNKFVFILLYAYLNISHSHTKLPPNAQIRNNCVFKQFKRKCLLSCYVQTGGSTLRDSTCLESN